MNQPSQPPSRLLKCMATIARWAWGLVLAFWLVVAVAWGGLHGWIVPRIANYRTALEQQASQALGVTVRIAAVTARSEGLFPSLELSGVNLLDAQGRQALHLARVVLTLSPRSLLRLGFEQIYIDAPELDVRRGRDGGIVVAGMALHPSDAGDSGVADWLFSQTEVVIRGGTLRWSDELRDAPPLALTQVDVLLRNGTWSHGLRLDATPPPAWGARFTLQGQLRAPLLSTDGADWRRWSGELFAQSARIDVAQLDRYVDLQGVELSQGHGALRAWADVRQGQVDGVVLDMALDTVNVRLARALQPLALEQVHGRVGVQRLPGGFALAVRDLRFDAGDDLHWPGGDVTLRYLGQGAAQEGELQADRLDLAALARIASRLPLSDALHRALDTYAPQGVVRQLQASWRGPLQAPRQYQARGKVDGLGMADAAPHRQLGLRGANLDFDFNQAGGQAQLSMRDGALLLPGVFEDPLLPLAQLDAGVRWQVDGARIAVQADRVRFANQDAAGEARLAWRTADPARSPAHARFPGVLELSGNLTRADGARVHRYLPLAVPADARHYVRDAVLVGKASQVKFRVKGDLFDFPFAEGGPGEFHIAARVNGVRYGYVPRNLQGAQELPWPALDDLAGELIFDRASMAVRNASGHFAGLPHLRVQQINASIPDLEHTVVDVHGGVSGPLGDMLALVRSSQVAQLTQGALDQASGAGAAQLQLGLKLPISQLDKSTVRGNVTLAGNDVRILPDAPLVSAVRGTVQFSEQGFSLVGMQGRALGGDVRLSGGLQPGNTGAAGASAVRVRAQGTATAEGLRASAPWAVLARLGQAASGSAAYTLDVGVRRGVAEVQVSSDLVGLALALPAPLNKPAQTPLVLRFERRLTDAAAASAQAPLHDRIALALGDAVRVQYRRDLTGGAARVLRGAIAVGTGPALALPEQGVVAQVTLDALDLGAWDDLLNPPAQGRAVGSAPTTAQPPAETDALQGYVPTGLNLRAASVAVHGRTLHQVVARLGRDGSLWSAHVSADELEGDLEFHPGNAPDPGLLRARLSRLALPQEAQAQAEELLDTQQPGTLPALDIEVQNFELHGRKLGRLEIAAQNRIAEGGQREWRLARFNLSVPEAQLSASGNWTMLGGAGSTAQRRTALKFQLDIQDSGALLARFGMDGVLRHGQGRIDGNLGWLGWPLAPDYRSMAGKMHVDVQEGQFLKADPGLAKLLGVLSLQSLPRRFTLDFRDVFSDGFAFDFVRGDVSIAQGVARTNNLQMKGVNAAVLMEGHADIEHETQDLHVVVVPEINAMTASLVATAINPVIGLGTFLAQAFLRGPLIQAATQEFQIDGSWAEPRVQRTDKRRTAKPAAASAPAAPQTPAGPTEPAAAHKE